MSHTNIHKEEAVELGLQKYAIRFKNTQIQTTDIEIYAHNEKDAKEKFKMMQQNNSMAGVKTPSNNYHSVSGTDEEYWSGWKKCKLIKVFKSSY